MPHNEQMPMLTKNGGWYDPLMLSIKDLDVSQSLDFRLGEVKPTFTEHFAAYLIACN